MLKQIFSNEIIEILSLSPDQRNEDHIKKLKSFCHSLSYFESFDSENIEEQEKLNMVLKQMKIQQNKKNDHLFDSYYFGINIDGKSQKYFIVVEGKVNIYQKLMLPNPQPENQVTEENSLFTLKEDLIYNGLKLSLLQTKEKGDSIGMIDLIYKRNYQTTAICQTDCLLFTLSTTDFQKYLKDFEHRKMMDAIQFLSQIPHFSNQSFGYLRDIAVNSNHLINLRGDVIYGQSQNVDSVYIIKSGEYAVLKKYDRKAVLTSPIEKIIQDNIQEQGGPLFIGSPKIKKDLRLKIMTQYEIFGEEDIIKGIQLRQKQSLKSVSLLSYSFYQKRDHSVVCESRKGECLQISTNLFIQKVIDLESTRATFSEIQKNKQISSVQQDQGNKASIKNYKSFYFEEKLFQDLSPQRNQDTTPVNESFEKSPVQIEKKDMSFSAMTISDPKKQNDKLPKINIFPSAQGNGSTLNINNTVSQPQLTKTNTNGNESMEDIPVYQEIIPQSKNSFEMISISRLNDESRLKQQEENEITFTETNGIRKHVLKKKQLKLHLRRNSREMRSTSLFTNESNNNEANNTQQQKNQTIFQKTNCRIILESDAQFGVDNIKDLQKIITTSHVKNELQSSQPKDVNNYGRLNMQKNYERSLKDKPKEEKQVYTFELDEKERHKVIVRKQKYRNYIHDWKKSPSPPQSARFDEQEELSRKTYISKNQLKIMQETQFLQKLEKNKNKIEELNSNALLSSFYNCSSVQNSYRKTSLNQKSNNNQQHQNSKSVNTSINYKDKSESLLYQNSIDTEQNSILMSLQQPRSKSPLAQLLLDQHNFQHKPQISIAPLMQDYVCSQIIETPQDKEHKQNMKQFTIPLITKMKEREDQHQQHSPYLSHRGNGNKNQLQSLWKQKIQITAERRKNAQSQMDSCLSSRRGDSNNNDIQNFMIQSQSSIKYVYDENREGKTKNNNKQNQKSITPHQLYSHQDQNLQQKNMQASNPNTDQSSQTQYRLASILTTQSRGKRKKVANSVDTQQNQNKSQLSQPIILSQMKNDNSKIGVISFTSVLKKQNNTDQMKDSGLKTQNGEGHIDTIANYQLKPIYKV